MTLFLQKTFGIILVCAAALLFIFGTTNLNEAQSLGGLMSGAPSTGELIILAGTLDMIAVCLAFGGIKLARLNRKFIGFLLLSTGIACLIFGVLNYINSPSNDGANDSGKMPVDIILHILTCAITATCLSFGGYLLKSKKIIYN